MIQTKSQVKVADNSGAKIIECFRILGGGQPNTAQIGDVFVASVKEAVPGGTVKKKEVVKATLVRQRSPILRKNGVVLRFDENAAVIIDDKGEPVGTRIFGPIAREIKVRGYNKIASLAPEVL